MKPGSLLALALLAARAAGAGLTYPALPDWTSAGPSDVSTGGALVDLDRDGWLDLVVANGNDIERQPLVVYRNQGDGTFPALPDWSSLASEYHGQLSAGDVDQDGWPDVAVAVFLGPGQFGDPGYAALYLNDGSGGLPPAPSWVSADRAYMFSVALGDADGDGDLDLAAAVGEPYFDPPGKDRVYYNQGGVLDPLPGWLSDEVEHNLGVAWGDVDGDGDLDLAVSGAGSPHRVYFQSAGLLETTSSWQSATAAPMAIRLALADLDRDGFTDLAVAENNQLGAGDGRFQVFAGGASGLSPTPTWSSAYTGYGSECAIGDANGDGWPDLLGGSWGQSGVYSSPVRAYTSRYALPLDAAPSWTSGTGSVIERLLLGDVNNDGLRVAREALPADGSRTLFRLARRPVQELRRVTADGFDLAPSGYCLDLESDWLSLAAPPAASLEVEYVHSVRPDLVATSWDQDQGNFPSMPAPLPSSTRCAARPRPSSGSCGPTAPRPSP